MPEFDSTIEYREIPGLPIHKVGNDGSVWSLRRNGWIQRKPDITHGGYLKTSIKGRAYLVHRLVLLAFVGPCPEGMQCRHYPDPDPSNNHVGNIRWGTPKENAEDRKEHGTTANSVKNYCPQGHVYEGENLYVLRGKRYCRICCWRKSKKWRLERKSAREGMTMKLSDVVAAAQKQQKLTGKQDAVVSLVIPGKWPASGKKRLCGRRGPLGQCMAEYEDAVMCLFKADELLAFASQKEDE